MFCRHCGEKLPDESGKFCTYCGKPIAKEKDFEYTAPSLGMPKKKSSLWPVFILAVILGFFPAIIATAAFPTSWRIAGPVFCPEDTQDYVVLRTTTSTSEGTSVDGTLYCIDPAGKPLRAGAIFVGFTVFGLNFAAFFVLGLIFITLMGIAVWKRKQRAIVGAPIHPQ